MTSMIRFLKKSKLLQDRIDSLNEEGARIMDDCKNIVNPLDERIAKGSILLLKINSHIIKLEKQLEAMK